MDYNFLIEQNKEYQDLYREYNEILNKKREKLKNTNNKIIESLDLDSLDYTQLKELIDLISYNIDDNLKEQLNQVYLSKKPFTNKVVEKMEFLDKDKKTQLDVNLSYFKNRYILSAFWTKIRVNKEERQKIIDILFNEGYLREEYNLHCPKCHNVISILREKDLNNLKEFVNIKEQILKYEQKRDNIDLTEEEYNQLDKLYDKYYDIEAYDNPLYHYCDNCDYEHEFDSSEEMFKFCKSIYYIK